MKTWEKVGLGIGSVYLAYMANFGYHVYQALEASSESLNAASLYISCSGKISQLYSSSGDEPVDSIKLGSLKVECNDLETKATTAFTNFEKVAKRAHHALNPWTLIFDQ